MTAVPPAQLLDLFRRQDLRVPAQARAAVCLLWQAAETLMRAALAERLAGTGVRPTDIDDLQTLAGRFEHVPEYVLSADDRALLGRLQAALPAPAQQPARRSILIVEDEPQVRQAMGRAAARRGYTVAEAATAVDAIARMKERRPDLVFLDVSLPDRDGISLLADIRGTGADMPVYFITGIGGDTFREEALRCGATDCFAKPVDLAVIDGILAADRS